MDFALVLSNVIDSMREDPAQLRNAVYELARVKLEEEACLKEPSVSGEKIKQLKMALETAIQGIETFALRTESRTAQHRYSSIHRAVTHHGDPMMDPRDRVLFIDHSPVGEIKQLKQLTAADPVLKRITVRSPPGRLLVLLGLVIAGLYASFGRQFGASEVKQSAPAVQAASVETRGVETQSLSGATEVAMPGEQRSFADPRFAGLPFPRVYGVYAISNGQLNELDTLPGRVPDPRVHISTPINKPSHTILPDGRVVLIVFRRDFATSAPDRVSIRAVAKIRRGMTFDANGKADTATLEDLWTIRSVSYDFRVAPLGENSEMFVLRPEASDFVLPAGRYALVIKGQGYDFTVAGTVTEPAQCLERIQAANGTFYSECRDGAQTRNSK